MDGVLVAIGSLWILLLVIFVLCKYQQMQHLFFAMIISFYNPRFSKN
jgi:hypothetical protein